MVRRCASFVRHARSVPAHRRTHRHRLRDALPGPPAGAAAGTDTATKTEDALTAVSAPGRPRDTWVGTYPRQRWAGDVNPTDLTRQFRSRCRSWLGSEPVPPGGRANEPPTPPSAPTGQAPWHFLNFLPEPHQQGSLRPILGPARAGSRAPPPFWPFPPAAPRPTGSVPATAARPSIDVARHGRGVRGCALDGDAEDRVGHVVADGRLELVEHPVRLDLELVQRVALRVGAQADAAPHVVDGGEVLDPQRVDDAQQHEPLEDVDALLAEPRRASRSYRSRTSSVSARPGRPRLARVVEDAQVGIGQRRDHASPAACGARRRFHSVVMLAGGVLGHEGGHLVVEHRLDGRARGSYERRIRSRSR